MDLKKARDDAEAELKKYIAIPWSKQKQSSTVCYDRNRW